MTPNPIADRWRRVSAGFDATVDAVPPDRWNDPSPCAGWLARDIVDHLVGWVPPFLAVGAEVALPDTTGLDTPAAWRAIAGRIQTALEDPDLQGSTFDHPQAGAHTFAEAVDRFICADVLVHTWDLATATGQAIDLDEEATAAYLAGFEGMDPDALVQSGQFGPRVDPADDSSAQIRLLALVGRSA